MNEVKHIVERNACIWTDITGQVIKPGFFMERGSREDLPSDEAKVLFDHWANKVIGGYPARVMTWAGQDGATIAGLGVVIPFSWAVIAANPDFKRDLSGTEIKARAKTSALVHLIANYVAVALKNKAEVFLTTSSQYLGFGCDFGFVVGIPQETIAMLGEWSEMTRALRKSQESVDVLVNALCKPALVDELQELKTLIGELDLTTASNGRDILRSMWTAYAIHAKLTKEPFALRVMLLDIWPLTSEGDDYDHWEDFDEFSRFMNDYID